MFRPAPNKAYTTGEAIKAVPPPSATTQPSPQRAHASLRPHPGGHRAVTTRGV